MSRRLVVLVTAAALAMGGVAVGLTLVLRGSSTPTPATAATSYAYYQSVMGQYSRGTMMGGSSSGWMMGQSGYTWMMGGANAPGWMSGGSLPNTMMGEGSDPGTIMGSLFANAPGPRLSASQAIGPTAEPGLQRPGPNVAGGCCRSRRHGPKGTDDPSVRTTSNRMPSIPRARPSASNSLRRWRGNLVRISELPIDPVVAPGAGTTSNVMGPTGGSCRARSSRAQRAR